MATAAIIAAEFTKRGKGEPNWLTINRIENGRRALLLQVAVAGKIEARQVAKKHGAQPWNF